LRNLQRIKKSTEKKLAEVRLTGRLRRGSRISAPSEVGNWKETKTFGGEGRESLCKEK